MKGSNPRIKYAENDDSYPGGEDNLSEFSRRQMRHIHMLLYSRFIVVPFFWATGICHIHRVF